MTKKDMLNSYSIYMEGFRTTGETNIAHFVGVSTGLNFKHACKRYYKDDVLYDEENNTYWGCELYFILEEAQRSFG